MTDWWQWSPKKGNQKLGFAVVGIGRFGSAVCRELLRNGADVLAVDSSEKAIEELRQLEPTIEARMVDSTDEEAMKEVGVLVFNGASEKFGPDGCEGEFGGASGWFRRAGRGRRGGDGGKSFAIDLSVWG